VAENAAIFHLVAEAEFRSQISDGAYRPSTLEHVGFVHCAKQNSVLPIANDYFSRTEDRVLLLEIDPSALSSEFRYEAPAPISGGGKSRIVTVDRFPHVYGPIETEAISRIGALRKTAQGFRWPTQMVNLPIFLSKVRPRT